MKRVEEEGRDLVSALTCLSNEYLSLRASNFFLPVSQLSKSLPFLLYQPFSVPMRLLKLPS